MSNPSFCRYNLRVDISYDPFKNEINITQRNLSFERAVDFVWDSAAIEVDTRKSYSERRFVAISYLDARLHVLCFAHTATGIRVISFRKANQREAKYHGKPLTDD